ncbi:SDR family oxidoreductase [Bacillus kwashiorkori]|uniref:SDR family oxidoreductase n=1 Tax=Bacillus kwashiorkori TaxID=1522318 RepID=UPI0007830327|nr:SDR family oxidoreductase [Bacillus kwashiorkori]
MGNNYLFTGFPGFIANQLIKKLIEKEGEVENIYVLTLPAMKEKAEQTKATIITNSRFPKENFHIYVGDITKQGLGLSAIDEEKLQDTTYVFHLAAIYDLAVPRDIAYLVNVTGTKHVNDWVKSLPAIKRYVYFSTAYVAGLREGLLKEDELIRPHAFKNFYEETKYEAEVLVEALKASLPVTIIRPGIVKGHSLTGETTKFDGPYLFLNVMDRLKRLPIFPKMGHKDAVVNLIPIDFLIEAVLYLSQEKIGEGKTYHLTDPNPYTVIEIYQMMLNEMLGKKPKGNMPLSIVKFFLSFASIRKWLRVEKEIIDYFTWLGKFDSSIAKADLAEANIRCPDLKEQIPSMVKFYLQHKVNNDYHIPIR